MSKSEIEIVKYPKVKHVKMLVNSIYYKEDHLHNDFELFLVLKNSGSCKIDGKAMPIKEGDIVLINSGEVHSYVASTPEGQGAFPKDKKNGNFPLFLFVQVSNHFIREYFPQIRTTVFKSCKVSDYIPEEQLRKIRHVLLEAALSYFSESQYYTLSVVADLSYVLSLLYKYVPHEIVNEGQKQKLKIKNARLERIISYIDENFDTQIRLQDLANMENLSVTHFSHLFSSSFGVTFQEFVNLKRTEQCIRLMANKEKTLLEISYESGFSDPKYMNKMMLKIYGCTPKEYRKSLMDGNIQENVEMGESENIFNDQQALKALQEIKNS